MGKNIKSLKFVINNQGLGVFLKSIFWKYHPRSWFVPLVIFTLAFLVRLIYLWFIKDSALVWVPILDGQVYSDWGKEIAREAWWLRAPFWTEPGYAFFLGLMFKIGASNLTIILFQFILGSLSAVLLYLSGNKLWGKKAGIIAGLIYALLAPAVYYEGVLLKTAWEVFLLCLTIFLIVWWWESKKLWQMFILGLVLGLSTIFKANNLVIPVVLGGLILLAGIGSQGKHRGSTPSKTQGENPLSRKWAKSPWLALIGKVGSLIIGTFIVIAPITAINYFTGKDFVLINSSAGPNFYIGNWEGADGSFRVPEFVSLEPGTEELSWDQMAQAYTGVEMKPSEVNSFWLVKTFEAITQNPGLFISISYQKLVMLFNQSELADNYDIAYGQDLFIPLKIFIPFWLLGLLGAIGGVIAFKRHNNVYYPLIFIFLSYSLSLVSTHITGRYRLALAPILILFTSYLIIWLKKQFDEGNLGKITAVIVSGFIIAPFSLWSFSQISTTTTIDMDNNIASLYADQENYDQAAYYYQKSITKNKYYPNSKAGLAKIYFKQGKIEESIKLYQKAIALQPDMSTKIFALALKTKDKKITHKAALKQLEILEKKVENKDFEYDLDYVQGLGLLRQKQYEQAVPLLEKALEKNETWDVMSNLGVAYRNSKQPEKAMNVYLKAVFTDEYNLPARYNLANLYASENKYKDAAYHYSQILEWVPDYVLARFYLGDINYKMGNLGEALAQFQTFIKESEESLGKDEARVKADKAIRFLSAKITQGQKLPQQVENSLEDQQDQVIGK